MAIRLITPSLLLLLLLSWRVRPVEGHPFVNFKQGRLALSHDGNADTDDYGAIASAFAMIAWAGLTDKVVHVHVNSQLWKPLSLQNDEMLLMSTKGGANLFCINQDIIFDAWSASKSEGRQNNVVTRHLAAEIDKSTANDSLVVIIGGPWEVLYQAILLTNPDARKHVTLVSHSVTNDRNDGDGTGHTKEDVLPLGLKSVVKITDQNRGLWTGSRFGEWEFLKSHQHGALRWIYSRMVVSTVPDISDAGVTYYVLTGDPNSGPSTLEDYFSVIPAPECVLDLSDSIGQQPYGGQFWAEGARIEAEDYDLGGSRVAFRDSDVGNYWDYHRKDSVDIDLVNRGEGLAVVRTRRGEWLEYTVEVPKAGMYQLRAFAKRGGSRDFARVRIFTQVQDESLKTQAMLLVWNTRWSDESFTFLYLDEGRTTIRLFLLDSASLDWFTLSFA